MPQSTRATEDVNFNNELHDKKFNYSENDLVKINGLNNGDDFSSMYYEESDFLGREAFHDTWTGYKRESEHR